MRKSFYRIFGVFSFVGGALIEISAAVIDEAPEDIRLLRAILGGVFLVVGMVALGNSDRKDTRE